MHAKIQLLITSASALLICNCAGPTTPLGSVWSLRLPRAIEISSFIFKRHLNANSPKIEFSPKHQILHRSETLSVKVTDPIGAPSESQVHFLYNGLDVTTSLLRQARLIRSSDGHELVVKVSHLRLLAGAENQIVVSYNNYSTPTVLASYDPPQCREFDNKYILSTDQFEAPKEVLMMIERLSHEFGINPAFTAGLIAQESGFKLQTVSWARAIGLTQITPIAEQDLQEFTNGFPKYPGINELPFPLLKGLVATGYANSTNEWRLNAEYSIRGGLQLLKQLSERWSEKEKLARIEELFEDREGAKTQLVLASYNSGYSRVLNAFRQDGVRWMETADLRGIRRYVSRITSYCDQFSEHEVIHDQET